MEVPLKAKMSVDDISLDSRPVVIPERRARSSSPIKNRRSLPPNFFDMKLPSLPFANEEDIRSMTSGSNSSLSPKQLKLLSNSPAFSRLHVSTSPERSQYVIPIPFTLRLPPKLSSHNQNPPFLRSISPDRSNKNTRENSPSRSRSPNKLSKLVYNGNKYEKLESLSDSDEGEDERNHRGLMRRSAPPPVTANKRKSKKQTIQLKQMSPDELSTIDEASSYANSRVPSNKSQKEDKSLPLPPSNGSINIEKNLPQRSNEFPLESSVSNGAPNEFTFIVPKCTSPTRDTYYKNLLVPNLNPHNINNNSKVLHSSVTRSATEDNIRLLQQSNAPIETNDTVLKIHKRSFSDESKVSSLSSFSSFGGMLNPSPSPNLFIKNTSRSKLLESNLCNQFENLQDSRTISNGSTMSCESEGSSNASWNSLQRSIGINDSNSLSSAEILGSREVSPSGIVASKDNKIIDFEKSNNNKSLQSPQEKNEVFDCSDTDESEIADLYLNESDASINDKTEIKTPTYNESDNEGLGTRFNFPTGSSNITNSKTLRNHISPRPSVRSSVHTAQYRSPSGQIEIPDLDDKSTTGNYSISKSYCSVHGTTFDDINCEDSDGTLTDSADSSKLEPIGFPSKAARNVVKEHFKTIHSDSDSESDIESAKYSNYSAMTPKSKSTSCFNINERQLPPLPQKTDKVNSIKHPLPKSPIRHARHKSMFNIDFDSASVPNCSSEATKLNLHKKSKSVDLNSIIPISPSKDSNFNSKSASTTSSNISRLKSHKRSKSADLNSLIPNSPSTTSRVNPESVIKSSPQILRLKFHKRSKSVDLNCMISDSSYRTAGVNSQTLPLKTKDNKKVAKSEEMKILVTEPPKPIDYAVDFKEATGSDNFSEYPAAGVNTKDTYLESNHNLMNNEGMHNISKNLSKFNINQDSYNSSRAPYVINLPQNYEFGSYPTPYNIPTPKSFDMTASSSGSSYQSSRTTKNTNYTSMSDSGSVIIDLTKEKYDVCMIQRNSSTQSYRSVTERTKEGKEVEVVLVDDEDENDNDVDELASIYSKYRNNWVFRTESTTSCASNTSTASFESGIASESQLKLKPSTSLVPRYKKIESKRSIDRLSSQIQKQRFNETKTFPLNASNVGYNSKRSQHSRGRENLINTKPLTKELTKVQGTIPEGMSYPNLNSKYFDYASDSYDFNSFMKQRVSPK